MRKYKFTEGTKGILRDGRKITLHRICAERDFGDVKKGEQGGWIETEGNLSHNNDAWVAGNAQVFGNACVFGNAQVLGDAQVSGNAWVFGVVRVFGDAQVFEDARVSGNAWVFGDVRVSGNVHVFENAQVFGDARVSENAWVLGNAQVSGDARVFENAQVFGDARVFGNAQVFGNARVSGNAWIFRTRHVFTAGPIGSRDDFVTFFRDKGGGISVKCGCFFGKLGKFLEEARKAYGDSKYAHEYTLAAENAKACIDLAEDCQEPPYAVGAET